MANDGTGQGWSVSAPANIDAVATGAQEIRDLRLGVAIRSDKEHVASAAASVGGEHKSGSAKAYYQATAPTQRPDAATTLTVDDNGRLFVDSDDKKLYVFVHGTGFLQVYGLISDDAVTTAKILDDAVTTAKIPDDAITTAKIVDDAITTDKILDEAITPAKIPDGSITLAKLDVTGIKFRGSEALYEDRKSSGSNGGNTVATTWTKHDLTTEVFDESSIGTLSSSQITLGAGTYKIEATGVFYKSGASTIRVYDVTNSATVAKGMSIRKANGSNTADECHAVGYVTLVGTTVLELQYFAETSETNGLGIGVNTGDLEVFGRVLITTLP